MRDTARESSGIFAREPLDDAEPDPVGPHSLPGDALPGGVGGVDEEVIRH